MSERNADFEYGARGDYGADGAAARSQRGYETMFGGRGQRMSTYADARIEGREPSRLADDVIRDAVREYLFKDSFIDPNAIEVAVEDGVVTLRGEVVDFMQARYVWDDAWETPGVRGVINHLTVTEG